PFPRASSVLCSLSLPRRSPPTPTLFPYTTLFRSALLLALGSLGSTGLAAPLWAFDFLSWRWCFLGDSCPGCAATAGLAASCSCSDRKSTRLNSSHVAISYAVFCLKKKTMSQPDDG